MGPRRCLLGNNCLCLIFNPTADYITLNMFAADFYKMVKNCQVRFVYHAAHITHSTTAGLMAAAAFASQLSSVPRITCSSGSNSLDGSNCVDSRMTRYQCALHLSLSSCPFCLLFAPAAVQRLHQPLLPGRPPPVRPVLGRHALLHTAVSGCRRHCGAQAVSDDWEQQREMAGTVEPKL